jgi:hypothetical protein
MKQSRQRALDAAVWMRGRISGLAGRRCRQVKVQVRVLAGSESPRKGLDIDYRRLSSIDSSSNNNSGRLSQSVLCCIDASGVGEAAGRRTAGDSGQRR